MRHGISKKIAFLFQYAELSLVGFWTTRYWVVARSPVYFWGCQSFLKARVD